MTHSITMSQRKTVKVTKRSLVSMREEIKDYRDTLEHISRWGMGWGRGFVQLAQATLDKHDKETS